MKIMVILIACLVFVWNGFSQGQDSIPISRQNYQPGTKEFYIKNSDDNRMVGSVLLVGGFISTVSGIVVSSSKSSEWNDFTGPSMMLGGLLSMSVSAIFYALSVKNARLALKYAQLNQRPGFNQNNKQVSIGQMRCSYTINLSDMFKKSSSRK
jgi:hypothetical protein